MYPWHRLDALPGGEQDLLIARGEVDGGHDGMIANADWWYLVGVCWTMVRPWNGLRAERWWRWRLCGL